jgi:hypothetical protein
MLHESFYERHHGMIGHSGLLNFGDRFVWWIFQLTKRDMAMLVFLLLALVGMAHWILHLWTIVAGASVILTTIASFRSSLSHGHAVTREPTSQGGYRPD